VDLWNRREFAWFLGMGNLKARNASTALGLAWWALNPLLLGLVYFFVFGLLFDRRIGPGDLPFVSYLMSGMFVFHFTAQSMTGGANAVLQNSKLLANIRFPRLILPIANLVEAAVGFLSSILVLYLLAGVLDGLYPGWTVFGLVLVVPLHLVFNLGLGALVARLAVPFRDINNFVPYLNRIWLYLSPVIWPLSFLEGKDPGKVALVELNPMYHLIQLYRWAFFGSPVEAKTVWSALFWSFGVGVVGIALFVRHEGKIVRYL